MSSAGPRFRVGSWLAFTGLVLGFVLSWHLQDPTPFTAVGGAAVAGKWAESVMQRHVEGKAP